MKTKKGFKILIVTILVFGLTNSIIPLIGTNNEQQVNHNPISIDGNGALVNQASSEGWLGSGTIEDPFLINGYTITNCNVSITIKNTDLTFKITNCILENINWGIALYNVTNAQISGNTINNIVAEYYGIYLESCEDILIEDNTIHDCQWVGVELTRSNNNTISSNTISNCSYRGILISNSNSTILESNIVYNNRVHGIQFQALSEDDTTSTNDTVDTFFNIGCYQATIHNNTVYGNTYTGMEIDFSSNFTITENIIFNNKDGIVIYGNNHIIANNTIYNNLDNGLLFKYTQQAVVNGNNFIGNNHYIINNHGSLSQMYIHNDSGSDFSKNYWSDLGTANEYKIEGEAFITALEESIPYEQLDSHPLETPKDLDLHILSIPRVLSPNTHETYNGTIEIVWTPAIDFSGHVVDYSIFYSSSGDMWDLLVEDLTTTTYDWDTSTVPEDGDYQIKIVAECSNGLSVEDVSDERFTIQNNPVKTASTTSPGLELGIAAIAISVLIYLKSRRHKNQS